MLKVATSATFPSTTTDFVGDVELRVGPLDVDARCGEALEGLVVRPVTAGTGRVEHHPDVDPCAPSVDDGLDEAFIGQRELLDQQRCLRRSKEIEDWAEAVIRFDDQAGTVRLHEG